MIWYVLKRSIFPWYLERTVEEQDWTQRDASGEDWTRPDKREWWPGPRFHYKCFQPRGQMGVKTQPSPSLARAGSPAKRSHLAISPLQGSTSFPIYEVDLSAWGAP